MRVTHVYNPMFTVSGMRPARPDEILHKYIDIRLSAKLKEDVPGLAIKDETITTSRVVRVDLDNCFAVTKSGNMYVWESR